MPELETVTARHASLETVWAVLTHFASYPEALFT